MKKIYLVFILVVTCVANYAQPYFALHHEGEINLYESFGEVITNSVDNDTIYVPGGGFSIGTVTIDKKLTIFGVGYYPDSCKATSISNLIGNLRICTGADGGMVTGLNITGYVTFGTSTSNQTINNYTIKRCRITSYLYLSYNGSANTESTNIKIYESVVNGVIYGGYANSVDVAHCIFGSYVNNFSGAVFRNCIMLFYYSYNSHYKVFNSVSNCAFENNIILDYNPFNALDIANNVWNNNLFQYNVTFPVNGNDGENNIVGQAISTIFVNADVSTSSSSSYSYTTSYDYTLAEECLGKNAGTDGTDMGVFGTEYPLKYVPQNPHINFKSINNKIDDSGILNIEVQVSSQER